jgi:beta-glucosidase/6-phospho-beta-glucosidase/beta-galactosidase
MTILRLKQVDPSGLRKVLVWIKNEYNNPPAFVTENGYSDMQGLHDTGRIKYFVVSKVHFTNSNKTYQR